MVPFEAQRSPIRCTARPGSTPRLLCDHPTPSARLPTITADYSGQGGSSRGVTPSGRGPGAAVAFRDPRARLDGCDGAGPGRVQNRSDVAPRPRVERRAGARRGLGGRRSRFRNWCSTSSFPEASAAGAAGDARGRAGSSATRAISSRSRPRRPSRPPPRCARCARRSRPRSPRRCRGSRGRPCGAPTCVPMPIASGTNLLPHSPITSTASSGAWRSPTTPAVAGPAGRRRAGAVPVLDRARRARRARRAHRDESARLIEPRPNRLVVFDVSDVSLHQVREVVGGLRISLAGWFYA